MNVLCYGKFSQAGPADDRLANVYVGIVAMVRGCWSTEKIFE